MVMTSETKKKKAQGGKRVMYTTHHPAWDAKNRHGLPDELPMEYAAIAHIFESSKPKAVEGGSPSKRGHWKSSKRASNLMSKCPQLMKLSQQERVEKKLKEIRSLLKNQSIYQTLFQTV